MFSYLQLPSAPVKHPMRMTRTVTVMNLEVQAIALGVQITGVGQLVGVDNVGVLL
jgi:hypothetical protein